MEKYGIKLNILLSQKNNNNSHDYDKTYMKIKFNSDDQLPLKKSSDCY